MVPASQPAPASASASFVAGSPLLRASGRVPAVVTKEGRAAYEVVYAKGAIHPKGTTANCTFAPDGFFPADACRFRFKVWFEDGFPWGPDMKKVAGKLIGLTIGKGSATGGNYSSTASTYRVTWSHGGGVQAYLYPQVRGTFSKKRAGEDIAWDQLDQSPQVRAAAYVATGVHVFAPRDKKDPAAWDLRVHTGRWNDVEMVVRLNTPGRYDGVLGLTVNGVTRTLDTVRYRYDDAPLTAVSLGTFFGGSTRDYAPPRDTRAWFADFEFTALPATRAGA